MNSTLGIFIVGTSPMPIYLSMKNFIASNNSIKKCIFLCTKDSENGTEMIANKLSTIFTDNTIQNVFIERANIKNIENVLKTEVLSKETLEGVSKVYIDFTGGTKLQSAIIRNRIKKDISKRDNPNRDIHISRIDIEEVYVNGYENNLQINDNITEFHELDDIELEEVLTIHGYTFIDETTIKKDDSGQTIHFDEMDINDGICEFYRILNIESKNAKLELFNFIYDVDSAGGEFSKIKPLIKPNSEVRQNSLKASLAGTKQKLVADRITFVESEDL